MTVRRRCLTCGRVGTWTTPRCPEHQAATDAARERKLPRRAVKAARYDNLHRMLRRAWAPYVEAGTVRCGRAKFGQCLHADTRIATDQSWDLDHLPDLTRKPSHADCNRAARNTPRSITR
jgi:hypothetical protein